ncbi:hypothetical protein HY480_01165 [Candidatus Uhrbacteria bacterium]|nr:hypothetical protein [Candidatus Uhrbacteria bacterium]
MARASKKSRPSVDAILEHSNRMLAHAEGALQLSKCEVAAMDRRSRFGSILGRLANDPKRINVNGHRGVVSDGLFLASVAYDVQRISDARVAAFLKAYDQCRHASGEPVVLGESCGSRCHTCGKVVVWETDGEELRVRDACAHPNGIIVTTELNVPSGVFIVGNDFRPEFDLFGSYDINTEIGCARTTEAMARVGCAHAYVGNTSPYVYRTGPTTFIIARPGEHPETGREVHPKGRRVAQIATQLWWYSIVDGDEFTRRWCTGYEMERVRVKPGVYRFTHFRHSRAQGNPDDHPEQPYVFTAIEWVRPPDPVRDFLADVRSQNFTAGQVIADMLRQFPTIYDGPDAVQRAANHMLCAIGGGGDWHPNGFVQYNPDMDPEAPSVRIPKFAKQYRWDPLSEEYSAVCRAAGIGGEPRIPLNPSFVALARNVLTCIVRYGTEPQDGQRGDPNLKLAEQCLAGLDRLYPATS